MKITRTEAPCADVFTKTFKVTPNWQNAVKLVGIVHPESKTEMPPEPGPRPKEGDAPGPKGPGGKSKSKKKGPQIKQQYHHH